MTRPVDIPIGKGETARVGVSDPVARRLFVEAKQAGMSDAEIARRTGYNRACLSDWRRGRVKMRLAAAHDLARLLGYDLALVRNNDSQETNDERT